jgi:hypothetical protein
VTYISGAAGVRPGTFVDVRLDDLDPEADHVDGLAERDHAGQGPRGGAEHGGRGVAGRCRVVAEAEPVHEALNAGLEDLPDPPTWDYLLFEDHPTVLQRIAMARAWQARNR